VVTTGADGHRADAGARRRVFFSPTPRETDETDDVERFARFADRAGFAARSTASSARSAFVSAIFFWTHPGRVGLAEDLAPGSSEPGAGLRAGSGAGRGTRRARRDRARFARDDGFLALGTGPPAFFSEETGAVRVPSLSLESDARTLEIARGRKRPWRFFASPRGLDRLATAAAASVDAAAAAALPLAFMTLSRGRKRQKGVLPDEIGKARCGVTNASRGDCSSVSDNGDASRDLNERHSRLESTGGARGRAVASGRVREAGRNTRL